MEINVPSIVYSKILYMSNEPEMQNFMQEHFRFTRLLNAEDVYRSDDLLIDLFQLPVLVKTNIVVVKTAYIAYRISGSEDYIVAFYIAEHTADDAPDAKKVKKALIYEIKYRWGIDLLQKPINENSLEKEG